MFSISNGNLCLLVQVVVAGMAATDDVVMIGERRLEDLKVTELKAELKKLNLPASGVKKELAERLRGHFLQQRAEQAKLQSQQEEGEPNGVAADDAEAASTPAEDAAGEVSGKKRTAEEATDGDDAPSAEGDADPSPAVPDAKRLRVDGEGLKNGPVATAEEAEKSGVRDGDEPMYQSKGDTDKDHGAGASEPSTVKQVSGEEAGKSQTDATAGDVPRAVEEATSDAAAATAAAPSSAAAAADPAVGAAEADTEGSEKKRRQGAVLAGAAAGSGGVKEGGEREGKGDSAKGGDTGAEKDVAMTDEKSGKKGEGGVEEEREGEGKREDEGEEDDDQDREFRIEADPELISALEAGVREAEEAEKAAEAKGGGRRVRDRRVGVRAATALADGGSGSPKLKEGDEDGSKGESAWRPMSPLLPRLAHTIA